MTEKKKRIRTKRVTLYVPVEVDDIKTKLENKLGIPMTYPQVFAFLIHFYTTHASEPRTQWRVV